MTMLAFTKRNILLYFRDKITVFFSLFAVFILIALYVLFLGDLTAEGIPEFPSKNALLVSWFLAGVLAVTSMTTTLGAFGILVEDRASQKILDFYASPIPRAKLVGGYIFSAIFVGIFMSLVTFIIADFYLFFSGIGLLPFRKTLIIVGLIVLSVFASSSMVLFIVSFLRTSNAFSAVSMVIGTLLGFLAGIYIPIGNFPDYLQLIVKLFPVSHSAALLRQFLMESYLIEAFTNAPVTIKETFELDMGVLYEINGKRISKLSSIIYLIFTTIFFFTCSLINMKRKRN
jgi:multidrug/hemolysin transport system permease protein